MMFKHALIGINDDILRPELIILPMTFLKTVHTTMTLRQYDIRKFAS